MMELIWMIFSPILVIAAILWIVIKYESAPDFIPLSETEALKKIINLLQHKCFEKDAEIKRLSENEARMKHCLQFLLECERDTEKISIIMICFASIK